MVIVLLIFSAVRARPQRRNYAVAVVALVVVVLNIARSLLLALESALGQLLHHLEELLAVVLKQVVGHREDA